MSNKKHTDDLVAQQEANRTKEDRLEHLILIQGSYLHKLGSLIRGKASRKDLKKYVDKYGIGK